MKFILTFFSIILVACSNVKQTATDNFNNEWEGKTKMQVIAKFGDPSDLQTYNNNSYRHSYLYSHDKFIPKEVIEGDYDYDELAIDKNIFFFFDAKNVVTKAGIIEGKKKILKESYILFKFIR